MLKINRKSYLILALIITIGSCSSITDTTTQYLSDKKHWQSMAKQSTYLSGKGLYVNASLEWKETQYGKSFKLTNISFSSEIKENQIDLLNPVFDNKYVCHWYCELVNEIQLDNLGMHYTYLSKLYNENATKLSSFYSKLSILQQKLHELNNEKDSDIKLNQLIASLSDSKSTFKTMAAVNAFLTKNLLTSDLKTPLQDVITSQLSSNPSLQSSRVDKWKINQQLCTTDNYFGRIIRIRKDSVILQIEGVAMKKMSNKLVTLAGNALKNKKGPISYVPLNELQTIGSTNLFTCTVSIFNHAPK